MMERILAGLLVIIGLWVLVGYWRMPPEPMDIGPPENCIGVAAGDFIDTGVGNVAIGEYCLEWE